jgi:hypothetical protein
MEKNVFYYETDHKGEITPNSVPDSSDSISDQILNALRSDTSIDAKHRRLLTIFEKMSNQAKQFEQQHREIRDKYEKLLSENLKLKQMNVIEKTPKFKNKSEATSARSVDSPNKRGKNGLFARKLQENGKNSLLVQMAEFRHEKSEVSKSRQKIPAKDTKLDANYRSTKLKTDPDKELKRYTKLVDSIYRIREQVGEMGTRESKISQTAHDLQDLWKWLKEYFEEATNMKVKAIKLQKRNLNLMLFKDNVKKALKVDADDEELLETLRALAGNYRMYEALVDKSKRALKFSSSKKASASLTEFDKFLGKLLSNS